MEPQEELAHAQAAEEIKSNTPKTCFIIMPISNHPDYEDGHFKRVYDYLIKPACEKAGYEPMRADDEIKTDHITLTILKQIVNADMAICDMSTRNPNVFYELGMRQAFNKKTVLIKDNSTAIPFDIQDLRTLTYDKNLRIDNVNKSIEEIAKAIQETDSMKPDEINSMIQLLGIKEAKLSTTHEMNQDTSLIMREIRNLSTAVKEMKKNVSNQQVGLVYPWDNSQTCENIFEKYGLQSPDDNILSLLGRSGKHQL